MSNSSHDRYLDIQWSALSSIYYHERLAKRYDRYNRMVVFGSLLFSLAAGISFTGSFGIVAESSIKTIGVTSSSIVFFCTALSLAFNFIEKAHSHSNLARDWKELEYQAEAVWKNYRDSAGEIVQFEKIDLLKIGLMKNEPPTSSRLAAWSELRASRRLGLGSPVVGMMMRWMRHF